MLICFRFFLLTMPIRDSNRLISSFTLPIHIMQIRIKMAEGSEGDDEERGQA